MLQADWPQPLSMVVILNLSTPRWDDMSGPKVAQKNAPELEAQVLQRIGSWKVRCEIQLGLQGTHMLR